MRPRWQSPEPRLRNGKWSVRYRDAAGVRKSATFEVRTITEARKKIADLLEPVNKERASQVAEIVTLGAFVENQYLPHAHRKWKESTAATSEQRIQQHIVKGELATIPMRQIGREELQHFLDSRQLYSFSILNHLRWDFRAIFRMALGDGLISRDPTPSLFTPNVEGAKQEIMTREQIRELLAALELRERLFCRFALFAGMRPGEIIALRWSSFNKALAKIDQRVYKGKADRPKGRRGRNTSRVAAMPSSLLTDLAKWREFRKCDDAYVFPSSNLRTPIAYEAMRKFHIKPALDKVKLGWCTFQVMRRTWSSLSKAAGADQQAVADQLGHTVKVDLTEYSLSPIEDRLEAVEAFEKYVI
jgi:integrase